MADIEGVAAAGEVRIVAGGVLHQAIVGRVIDTPQTQGGPQMIAFPGVVVHHIQNHLNARLVQGLHHLLEFLHLLPRLPRRTIARVGGKVGQGVIAPVVTQTRTRQVSGKGVEMVHRQQFHGGDAQLGQVINHYWVGQAGVGAPQGLRQIGVGVGEAPHMGFVDNGAVPGGAGGAIALPVKAGINDNRFGDVGGAI